jgi:hypothetical protein
MRVLTFDLGEHGSLTVTISSVGISLAIKTVASGKPAACPPPAPKAVSSSATKPPQVHLTRRGGLDRRFNSSKLILANTAPLTAAFHGEQVFSAADLHFTRNGGLDMRYRSSRAVVSRTTGGYGAVH